MSPARRPSSRSGLEPRQTQRERARVDRKKESGRSTGCSYGNLGTPNSRQTRGTLGAKLSFIYPNWDTRLNDDPLNIELGSFSNPLIEVGLGPKIWGRAKPTGGVQRLQL